MLQALSQRSVMDYEGGLAFMPYGGLLSSYEKTEIVQTLSGDLCHVRRIEKLNLKTLMAGFVFFGTAVMVIIAAEYLNRNQLIPYSFDSSVSTYRNDNALIF